MAKTYGVVSTKGGVGKTSFCAQFGGILADMGQRVLLVDADFQQSLSRYYRIGQAARHGLRKLVTTADPASLKPGRSSIPPPSRKPRLAKDWRSRAAIHIRFPRRSKNCRFHCLVLMRNDLP